MPNAECPICRVAHSVCVPTVHLNGTAAEDLHSQLDAAVDALRDALAAMNRAHPNGRDYYPTNDVQRSIKEHCLRAEKLIEIAAELVQMRDHVIEAMNLRERAKAPRSLPRIHIAVNGSDHGEYLWDGRLTQLRKADNPSVFEEIDDPQMSVMFDSMKVGETCRCGGGAAPIFEYRRVA